MKNSIVQELRTQVITDSETWILAKKRLLAEVSELWSEHEQAERDHIIERAIAFTESEIRMKAFADHIGYNYVVDKEWDEVENKIEGLCNLAEDICKEVGGKCFDEQLYCGLITAGLHDSREHPRTY